MDVSVGSFPTVVSIASDVAEAIAEDTAEASVVLLLYCGPQTCSESASVAGKIVLARYGLPLKYSFSVVPLTLLVRVATSHCLACRRERSVGS